MRLSNIILIVRLLGFFLEANKPWTRGIPGLQISPSLFYFIIRPATNPFAISMFLNAYGV